MEKARVGYARQMARKVLQDCEIKEIPIDLMEILKKKGYKYMGVDTFLDNIDALFMRDKDDGSIYATVNSKHHMHRQRFSLAHELGHILLNHDLDYYSSDITIDNPPTSKSHTSSEAIFETEANSFAGELLVPLEILKREFMADNNLKSLSRKFLVSQQVMSIAITNHMNSLYK